MRYFSENDFKRACPACSLSDMSCDLLDRLDSARAIAGVPFVVNSAYRSLEYERKKGRSGTSSHTKGLAVDLKCADSVTRWKMLHALLAVGIRRIGVAKTFLHVDIDSDKPDCIWLY